MVDLKCSAFGELRVSFLNGPVALYNHSLKPQTGSEVT